MIILLDENFPLRKEKFFELYDDGKLYPVEVIKTQP